MQRQCKMFATIEARDKHAKKKHELREVSRKKCNQEDIKKTGK